MTERKLPAEEEMEHTGWALAIEDLGIKVDQVPDHVNFDLAWDVTDNKSGALRVESFSVLKDEDSFGERIYLLNDPALMRDVMWNGVCLFRTVDHDGKPMILNVFHVKRPKAVQKAVEQFVDAVAPEIGKVE